MELSVKNYAPDVHAYPNSVQQDFLVVPAATFEDDLNTMVDALTYDSSGSNVPRVIRNPFGYVNTPYSDVSTATNLPVTGNGYPLSNTRPMSGFLPLSVAYPPLDRHLFLPGHNINTYRPLIRPEFPATALRLPYRGRRNSRMNIIGGNNVVNVFRITHGQDVRTTVSFVLYEVRKC